MIPLDEAAELEGFPSRATLRRWCKAGEVRAEEVLKGSRLVWLVDPESVKAKLAGATSERGTYDALHGQWVKEQSSGYHTGKPIGKNGVDANVYGLLKFWEYLYYTPKEERKEDYQIQVGGVAEVTPANLRLALSNVPVDYENKNCHFSQREQMYKGVGSFMQFLIRNRIMAPGSLEELRKLKPRRVFPPRKTVLRAEPDFYKLLAINDGFKVNRTEVDIALTRTIMMLAAMAGLRKEELIDIEIHHVFLKHQELLVVDGKGHKSRRVGLVPALRDQLKAWLAIRPASKHPNLLVSKNGLPLDKGGIHRRLQRIAERAKVDITLHGLRRSFATLNIQQGMPVPVAQKLLGHSSVETTMEYILIDEQTAVDWLKHQTGGSKKAPPARK